MRSIASEVGINFGVMQSSRLDISKYLLSRYEDDPGNFIDRVVTQDETWVHHFDPESKMQSMRWKHPGSSIPRSLSFFGREGDDLSLLGYSGSNHD